MNHNKPKPDDRRDNVERIQYDINHTISNFRAAEEMIATTDDEKMKKDLQEKNARREQSIEGKRREIREEAIAKDKGYK